MIQIKITDPKVTNRKKTITFKDVYIENGVLMDENGSVGDQLKPELPDGVEYFTFKLSFELPDEADDEGNDREPRGYDDLDLE